MAGDGQFNSPSFYAKYYTYSIMNLYSSKIINLNSVRKALESGELERKCESILDILIKEDNCNIELFLTDRHRGIRFVFAYKIS